MESRRHFLASILAPAVPLYAGAKPLFVFDNGTGRGVLSIDEQVDLAARTGYAGLLYAGTKAIPELVAAHRARGLSVLGLYTGMDLSDPAPGYDPGLPDAVRHLKGTGAIVTFTVNGKAPNGDVIVIPVLRDVAGMAAEAGLHVALYHHYGFHMARVEHALRLRELIDRPNVGIVFNLCHWLRSGDEANMQTRLAEAVPHTRLVLINGADHEGDWDRLIQTLDRGEFDVKRFLATLGELGYQGAMGLQCFNIKGDREENLRRSMAAWRRYSDPAYSASSPRPSLPMPR
ncbi:MAG: TIM barrel protein [Bryobacteraceae bacterium]